MRATIIGIEEASQIVGIPKDTFKEMIAKVHRGGTENRWLGEVTLCVLGEKRNTYYVFEEALIDHLKIRKEGE